MYICYNMWLLDYLFRTFGEIIGLILALNRLPYVHNQNIERKTDILSVFLDIQNFEFSIETILNENIWKQILIQIVNVEFLNETDRNFDVQILVQKFWAKNSVILNTDKRTHKKLILIMRWKLFPKNVWSSDLGFCENHHHVWEIQLVLPKERWYSN